MDDTRYITAYDTDEGTRYRVRVPSANGDRISSGGHRTIEEARAERDRLLMGDEYAPRATVGYHPAVSNPNAAPPPGMMLGVSLDDGAFHYVPSSTVGPAPSYPGIGEFAHFMNTVMRAPDGPAINVPAAINALPDPPLTLSLSRWLYAADFHAPLHSVAMTRRLVQVGRARKVRDLVIGGDFLDLAHISRHGRANRLISGREAARVAGELLAFLLDEFNVYILPGNHDDRVAKKLDDDWSFKAVLYGMLEGRTFRNRLTVTDDYAYIYVQGANRKWIVGHPNFYAGFGAKGPAYTAQMQQCSVMGAHNHLQGVSWSADGKHIAIDPGCMTEAELTPYVMKHSAIGKHGSWKQGFVFVENDIPTICADGLVDWRSIGGE